MQKKFRTSLFLFRRDLRLEDNTGLIFALQSSETVIPAFIFTPEQIEKNPFKSEHCLTFMIESLEDLQDQLKRKKGKLFFFQGKPEKIVEKCIEELAIEAVVVNRDYTPYSLQRDEKIKKACKAGSIPFYSFDDALLHPPEETLKKEGKPYTIFTPYFRNASKLRVVPPVSNRRTNYFHGSIPFAKDTSLFPRKTVGNAWGGGRAEALKILKNLASFEKKGSSTHLSAYLKFTVCSPREVYAAICHQLHPHHAWIRSLYWRDFFTSIALFFPHVFTGPFRPKYNTLKWS